MSCNETETVLLHCDLQATKPLLFDAVQSPELLRNFRWCIRRHHMTGKKSAALGLKFAFLLAEAAASILD